MAGAAAAARSRQRRRGQHRRALRARWRSTRCVGGGAVMAVIILACPAEAQLLPRLWTVHSLGLRRDGGGCAGVRWGSTPDPGRSSHRTCAPRAGVGRALGLAAMTAALLAVWLVVDPRTPDLAAQVYRRGPVPRARLHGLGRALVRRSHLPGYSLLFPPLASLLGMRLLGVLSVLASTCCSSARGLGLRRARAGASRGSRWRRSATCGSGA